jgi:uncharacterized damage-inducible protein DinB
MREAVAGRREDQTLRQAWRTSSRATTYLIEHLPPGIWASRVPGVAYFVAHEAHHRGQLILVARQLGHRLPRDVTGGVWQWNRLARAGEVDG